MRLTIVVFIVGILSGSLAIAAPKFGPPINLGAPINSAFADGQCDISPSGTMLVFASTRPGGYGHYDLYMSTLGDHGWNEPINLGPEVNTFAEENKVSFSPDGMTIYFRSNRPGGVGGFDVYQSEWTGTEWGLATLMPGALNTQYNEWASSISPDGQTFWAGTERPGLNMGYGNVYFSIFDGVEWSAMSRVEELVSPYDLGGFTGPTPDQMILDWNTPDDGPTSYDLYWSERIAGVWQPPVSLGPQVNSSAIDWQPTLSVTGDTIFFASLRPGGLGSFDIWMSVRDDDDEETYPFGDLNCDGDVDLRDVLRLIHHIFRGTPLNPCCPCDCQVQSDRHFTPRR